MRINRIGPRLPRCPRVMYCWCDVGCYQMMMMIDGVGVSGCQ